MDPSKGKCVTQGNIAPLIELGAGFDMELTARENIYLNGALLGYPKKFIEDHFQEIVEFAEIENFLDIPLKNYSSGMVARIAFSIATAVVPDILIVDEVLAVGDTMFQQKCERRISTLINDHNVTVLIVSHDTNQIERLCNKAVWIEKGHMRMIGSAKEVCNVYRLVGGHRGSKESENEILTILNTPMESSARYTSFLTGDSPSNITVKLARTNFKSPATLIIVSERESALIFSSMSLSSELMAPIITCANGYLTDAACEYIAETQPQEIITVSCKNELTDSFYTELSNLLVSDTQITKICEETVSQTSEQLIRFLLRYKNKSDTVLLSYVDCTGDLLSLSAFAYKTKSPIVYCDENNKVSDTIIKSILDSSFKRLLLVGGPEYFSHEFATRFEVQGMEVVRICGNGPYFANQQINTWLMENRFLPNKPTTALVCSWQDPSYALTIGQYAGINDIPIILEDPADLDSVHLILQFIKERGATIQSLYFVDNGTNYKEQDKDLIEKALALSKAK